MFVLQKVNYLSERSIEQTIQAKLRKLSVLSNITLKGLVDRCSKL